jgi:hypothetical protein
VVFQHVFSVLSDHNYADVDTLVVHVSVPKSTSGYAVEALKSGVVDAFVEQSDSGQSLVRVSDMVSYSAEDYVQGGLNDGELYLKFTFVVSPFLLRYMTSGVSSLFTVVWDGVEPAGFQMSGNAGFLYGSLLSGDDDGDDGDDGDGDGDIVDDILDDLKDALEDDTPVVVPLLDKPVAKSVLVKCGLFLLLLLAGSSLVYSAVR